MQQDINLVIEDFKDKLLDMVNNTNLPVSIIAYVFNDVNRDIQSSYHSYLSQARAALKNNVVNIAEVEEDKED